LLLDKLFSSKLKTNERASLMQLKKVNDTKKAKTVMKVRFVVHGFLQLSMCEAIKRIDKERNGAFYKILRFSASQAEKKA
jgi:hypothetical protein